MNRRAQSGLDTILAIVTIFGLGLFCLIMTYTYSQFVTTAKASTTFNQTQQAVDVLENVEAVNNMWDYVILVILIGFAIAMVILGYFIDVNSVFLPIYILVLLVGLVISGVLSYAWDQIADSSTFTAVTTASFPITDHLMSNLALYYTIIGVIAMVATYAKTRAG